MFPKISNRYSVLFIACAGILLSCSSTNAYFKTPNDVLKMNATVTMQDGTIKTGLLTVLFENDLEVNNSLIGFLPKDSLKEQKFSFNDIQSYKLNNTTYVARYVNLYSNGTYRGLFLKLLSAEGSKMQLYQLEQKYKSNPTGEDRDFYYLSVPAFPNRQVVELQSAALVPSFENKMARFVSDCPVLAEKIRNQDKNYSYGFLTATFKKVEIIKRIIQEYDSCNSR